MNKYLLKLYITGHTARSRQAISTLRQICETVLANQYELIIIDVLERPQQAEEDKILATPTLIKEAPAPSRRVIGDLSDEKRLLLALDLNPKTITQMEGRQE